MIGIYDMGEYTFPFSTCEPPRDDGIAQPFSAAMNLITCCIIFFFLLHTKHMYTFALLLSILVFEAFHTFSHIVHIEGPIQINITHFLTYLMNATFFAVFYHYTHYLPSTLFLIYMAALIALDIYAFSHWGFVYYLATQSLVFISLLVYYYTRLPEKVQNSIYWICGLVAFVICLFINEQMNCDKMLAVYPDFPYHLFIESTGVLLFYTICSHFYHL
jgi:FtsH-binding integral membrane protein